MENKDGRQRAAISGNSTRNGKHNTMPTLQEAIAMLNSAMWYYQKAGGAMRIGNSPSQDKTVVAAWPGLQLCSTCHQLNLFEEMAGPTLCQKCSNECETLV